MASIDPRSTLPIGGNGLSRLNGVQPHLTEINRGNTSDIPPVATSETKP
ncbi:hypothetical protein [Moorena sp. SIOASIH]|nr:hypothetical protein [Moorena sp. SIOASIH]